MARLGELLAAAGLLDFEQIDQALRAQVMWGARLGTNLIELGLVDLDQLSSVLGQQHHMPSALARHFEKPDRELQLLLSPDVAHKLSVVPLVRVGSDRKIVIATTAPLAPKHLALIADELCVDPRMLIPAVAAELRIRYQLEKVYGLTRPTRFMRSPGLSRESFHHITFDAEAASEPELQLEAPDRALTAPVQLGRHEVSIGFEDDEQLTMERAPTEAEDEPAGAFAELDDLPPWPPVDDGGVPTAFIDDHSSGKERRTYVRTIADVAPEPDAGATPMGSSGSGAHIAALARIAIRRIPLTPPTGSTGNTLGEATREIRRATDRDKVASLAIETLFRFEPSCHAASLLVVRGQIATSWKGFCRSGAPEAEISVPLDQPGLVPRASHRNTTTRAPRTDLGPLDQRLMVSLGAQGELVVVPVSIGGQVICLIAMVTETDTPSGTAESIAAAAGAAFQRLMRDASR